MYSQCCKITYCYRGSLASEGLTFVLPHDHGAAWELRPLLWPPHITGVIEPPWLAFKMIKKIRIQCLSSAYCFHAIIKLKNPKVNHC